LERLAKISTRVRARSLFARLGASHRPQGEKITRGLERARAARLRFWMVICERQETCFDLRAAARSWRYPSVRKNSRTHRHNSRKSAPALRWCGPYDNTRTGLHTIHVGAQEQSTDERRTIHLGMRSLCWPGRSAQRAAGGRGPIVANIRSPGLRTVVITAALKPTRTRNFSHSTVILKRFARSPERRASAVARGQTFAHVGSTQENWGGRHYVQFQIISI